MVSELEMNDDERLGHGVTYIIHMQPQTESMLTVEHPASHGASGQAQLGVLSLF